MKRFGIILMYILSVLIITAACSKDKDAIVLKEYTITFNTDGGSEVKSVSVMQNKKLVKPVDPTKNAHVFVEWQLDNVAFDFESVITKDIKLVAKWAKIPVYTVSFNTDGGSAIEGVKVIKDKKVSKPIDPIKDAYTFDEWQLDNVAFDFESLITKDIILVAKWTKIPVYTVSFNTNGGNTIEGVKVIKDKKVSKPIDPIKDAYNFVEWQLDNVAFDFESLITKDITLVAKWTKTPVYTVSFNTDGGNVIDGVKVIRDKKVSKPTNPIKDAYTFIEWQLDNVTFDFGSAITKDITLVAKWAKTPIYTVSFNTDGGNTIDAVKVIRDKKLIKPSNPIKNAYDFVEWQLDNVTFDFESLITKDITLVAKWAKIPVYTVSFNTDGGNTIDGVKVVKNKKLSKPANPTKDACYFVEWQLNNVAFDFESVITKDITLVAKWESNGSLDDWDVENAD
ncbi:MAG: InlB B-repeat-containing protein, partial [Marinifilaceae bacterium]